MGWVLAAVAETPLGCSQLTSEHLGSSARPTSDPASCMHTLARPQAVTQVLGSLPPLWEMWAEFPAPGFVPAQPQLLKPSRE